MRFERTQYTQPLHTNAHRTQGAHTTTCRTHVHTHITHSIHITRTTHTHTHITHMFYSIMPPRCVWKPNRCCVCVCMCACVLRLGDVICACLCLSVCAVECVLSCVSCVQVCLLRLCVRECVRAVVSKFFIIQTKQSRSRSSK